eukprot:1179594-Amphidinium_carterae.1
MVGMLLLTSSVKVVPPRACHDECDTVCSFGRSGSVHTSGWSALRPEIKYVDKQVMKKARCEAALPYKKTLQSQQQKQLTFLNHIE